MAVATAGHDNRRSGYKPFWGPPSAYGRAGRWAPAPRRKGRHVQARLEPPLVRQPVVAAATRRMPAGQLTDPKNSTAALKATAEPGVELRPSPTRERQVHVPYSTSSLRVPATSTKTPLTNFPAVVTSATADARLDANC